MASQGDISKASLILQLLMEAHGEDAMGEKTLNLFDTLVSLPGALAVVKAAIASGEGDPGLLCDLECTIISGRTFGEFRSEMAAYKRIASEIAKEAPPSVEGLLHQLKRAQEEGRVSNACRALEKIIEMGASSKKPEDVLLAMKAFAEKEPSLAHTLGFAMEQIRFLIRVSTMERLADMKIDFPVSKSIGAPPIQKILKNGKSLQFSRN